MNQETREFGRRFGGKGAALHVPTTTLQGRRPLRVMNNLNESESIAVVEYVREMIASAATKPNLRGQALVESIPAAERGMIDDELVSAYLKMEAAT